MQCGGTKVENWPWSDTSGSGACKQACRPGLIRELVDRCGVVDCRSFGRFARMFLLASIRLLKAKQELVGVTADRRVEHIFGVIIVLICKN